MRVWCASLGVGLWLAVAADPAIAQPTDETAASAEPEVVNLPGPPPDELVVIPIPPSQPRPFQMGFEFTRVLDEDGDLAPPSQSANAVGLRFVFSEGRAIRQHLAVVHHWEQQGNVSRRGFRLDLLALGFPIPLSTGEVKVAIEPVLRALRGQVLFVSENDGPSRSMLRVESGFALGVTTSYKTYFMILEPFSIDFRYLMMTKDDSRSGFSRIWSIAATIGREF
jgi:hypothetical protein